MNMLKLTAAAALVAASLSASAMTTIADADLSAVAGQDGVSIGANLNINIGSFTYTNTTDNHASVSFNNIAITGLVAMTIDVVSNNTFTNDIKNAGTGGALAAMGVTATTASAGQLAAATATGTALLGTVTGSSALNLGTSDVVQFAFPQLDTATSGGVAHSFSSEHHRRQHQDVRFGRLVRFRRHQEHGPARHDRLDVGSLIWLTDDRRPGSARGRVQPRGPVISVTGPLFSFSPPSAKSAAPFAAGGNAPARTILRCHTAPLFPSP